MPNTQIDSLSINVQSSSEQAAKGIDRLTSSLSSLKSAISGGTVGSVAKKIQSIADAVETVSADKTTRLEHLATAISNLGNVKISSGVAKNITNIGKALDTISDSQIDKVQRLSSALKDIPQGTKITVPSVSSNGGNGNEVNDTPVVPESSDAVISETASNIDRVGNSADEGTKKVNTFAVAIENIKTAGSKVTGTLSSVGDAFRNISAPVTGFVDKIRSFGSGYLAGPVATLRSIKNEITGVGNESSSSSGKLGQLLSSIGRIAMYRAVRSAIKAVSAGIKTGIDDLYQYSATINGPFYQSMNNLASSFLYLKNSVGAAVAPLINAFAPAIDVVIDKVVTLINAFGKFMAALTGKGTYTRAKKVATTYKTAATTAGKTASDTADKVKKASDKSAKSVDDTAKKIKRTILGFDELNVLNDNSDDNKSGSGSSPSSGGSGSTPSTGGIKAATPDYGSMFEDVPIESEIKNLADAIRDAINKGDWEGLGKLLGEKVNSIFESIDWAGIGDKLGYGINGAIQTMYYFLKTVDFNAIGADIATMLNHAIGQIDWNITGRLLTRGWTSVIDFWIGFIQTFDWGQLARAISDFIEGAFDEATEWLNSYDWSELGNDLYNNIKDFITNMDVSGISDSIFTFLGTAIRSALGLLGGFFGDLWGDVVNAWAAHVAEYDYGNWAANFFTAISDALGDLQQWSFDHVLTPFMQGLLGESQWESVKNSVQSALEDIEEIVYGSMVGVGAVFVFSGSHIPLGLALMATGTFGGIGLAIEDWTSTKNNVETVTTEIEQFVSGMFLAVGATLAFSGSNTALGIGLMAVGATAIAAGGTVDWTVLPSQIGQVIADIMEAVGAAELVVGAVLTFSTTNVPLGLALLGAGAGALATGAAVDWESTTNKVQSVITTITGVVSSGLLAVGAVLVFTNVNVPLGLGMIAVGATGLASTIAADWDGMPSQIRTVITVITTIVSAATLAVGAILTLSGGATPLGIGLLAAGAAGLASTVALNWGFIGQKITEFTQKYGVLAGLGLVAFGSLLTVATGGTLAPLGIGMIVAGVASTVAQVALNWGAIGQKITDFFSKYGVLAGAGLISMGVLITIATFGVLAPLGIGMIVAGIASSVAQVALNWGEVGTKITDFFQKYGMLASTGLITLGTVLIIASFGTLAPLGIGMLVAGIGGTIATAAINGNSVGQEIENFFAKYGVIAGVSAIAIGTVMLLTGVFTPLGIALIALGIGSMIKPQPVQAAEVTGQVHDGLEGINNEYSGFSETNNTTMETIKKHINDTWDSITKKTSETWDSVTKTVGDAWSNLKESAGTTWGNITKSVGDGWSEIKQDTDTTWSNVKTTVGTTWGNLKQDASTTFGNIKETVRGKWDDITRKTSDTWSNVKQTVSNAAGNVASSVKGEFDESSRSVSSSTKNIKNDVSNGFGSSDGSGIRGTASSAFKAIADHVKKNMTNAANDMKSNVDNMKKAFSGANFGKAAADAFKTVTTNIGNSMKSAMQIVENGVEGIKSALSGIDKATNHTITQMQNKINKAISDMNSRVDRAVSSAKSRLNSVGGGFGGFNFDFDFSGLFSGFASGGFPESGQMFYARENGIPEMVGTIGGRTAVANNEDIVAAVSSGVAEAMISVLSQNRNTDSGSPVIEVVVKTEDDEVLARAVTRGQQKMNYRYDPIG